MKLSTMRNIDETVGTFLASLLGMGVILKKFLLPSAGEPDRLDVRTIVCQKYFGMGSILHALPLIKALRHHYPNANIIFLTLPSNADVVLLCRVGDEVRSIDPSSPLSFLRDILANLLFLIRRRVDISIDLEFYSKFSLLISLLCLAKTRVGLHMRKIRPKGILTNVVYYNNYKHISEIYFAYAQTLGIPHRPDFFSSLLPSMESEIMEQVWCKLSIADKLPVIVINVNVGDLFLSRRWPADHFVILIQNLINTYPDFHYVLIGLKNEFSYVEELCSRIVHHGNLVNFAGRTTILELFALIESSYMMISCDSGPLHIASLYGKNLVAFYGPETPIVYGPVNGNSIIYYSNNLYCSPCLSVYDNKKGLYDEVCRENVCLSCFMPEDVFQGIERRFLANFARKDEA